MTEENKNLADSNLYEGAFGYKERKSTVNFFILLFAVVLMVLGFRLYWVSNFGGVTVSGSSMCTTLYSGERLLMKKTDGSDAKRGDVIVVYVGDYEEFDDNVPEEYKTRYLIKRLIAVEGDKVRCEDGQIEIMYAGESVWTKLNEPYAYYMNKYAYDFGEYVVGAGEVFFLGDNRNNSQDSRYEQPSGSRLNRLYKRADIVGIVPQWAIDYQKILDKIFFWGAES